MTQPSINDRTADGNRQSANFEEQKHIPLPYILCVQYGNQRARKRHTQQLHNLGSAGHIKEVTSDGSVVWEVEWEGERLLGRTVFLEDLYDFAP